MGIPKVRQPVPEIVNVSWLSLAYIKSQKLKLPLVSKTVAETAYYSIWGVDQTGRNVCMCTFRMTGGTKTTRAQAVENMKQLANVRYAQGE